MSRVSVFGLGYVGSVTSACLAQVGNEVLGVDISPAKVAALSAGRSPIVEAGMDQLVEEGVRTGRLRATQDADVAVNESEISILCVATPSRRNGKLDLSSVEKVCGEIGRALRNKKLFHTVVLRSTVLPGTAESVVIPVLEAASGKRAGHDFAVCVNPEFMREGTAVRDFFQPPFTVIGISDPTHGNPLRQLYSFTAARFFETSFRVAEAVKYICNAYHALKICFANEVGTLCQQVGIDPTAVMEIFTADTKLNVSAAYLMPGFAFGGSCLPKDLRALTYRAKELDLHLPLLESVLSSNAEHIERAVQAILATNKRKIGMLGLSFKSGTDDLRESPSVQLIKRLLGEGCEITIWDDTVAIGRLIGSNRQYIEETIPHIGSLLRKEFQEVITSADVVLLASNALDHHTVVSQLRPDQILFDLAHMKEEWPATQAQVAAH